MKGAEEPWWIIGSVAVALQGGSPGRIRDVDVLLGHEDARRCFRQLNLVSDAATDDPLFHSDLFARWQDPPVAVELMAGLRIRSPSGWRALRILSREKVREDLFVPSRTELREILICFGREKDLKRAATLG